MRTFESSELNKTTPLNWAELVEKAVKSVRFGVVQIVVHNSQVVQIETTEKIRLDQKN